MVTIPNKVFFRRGEVIRLLGIERRKFSELVRRGVFRPVWIKSNGSKKSPIAEIVSFEPVRRKEAHFLYGDLIKFLQNVANGATK